MTSYDKYAIHRSIEIARSNIIIAAMTSLAKQSTSKRVECIGYCVRIPICAWNFSICWKTFSIPKHSLPQALRNCKNRLLSDARARWRYIKFCTFTPTIVCRVMMTGIFLSELFINSLIIVNDGNHNVTGNPQNLHVFQENPFPGLSTQHTSSVRSLCPTIFGVRGY